MKKKQLLFVIIFVSALAAALGFFANKKINSEFEDLNPYSNLGGDFTLFSSEGPVSLSDHIGKVVILFFGFTSCADVCPTGLSKIASVLNLLKEDYKDEVIGIFVSVDPERDSPEVSSRYASLFHENIIGVSGSNEEIAEVAKRYFILYERVEMPKSTLGYSIDHTASSYIIGPDGKIRERVQHTANIQEIFDVVRSVILGKNSDS